ncbi:helix-turn-helix domain-containing protein [Actinomadura rubrisoli]|uniref:XRE family transcriptional regulator n=1 Tax=Actinomadura rubrisoli TaxID=2530368 RepID=A0A4R5A639_9ACTN|nr:helix-turn-helix transcriptional regulator [Actinomadura rubrisoli]TDD65052.1 XRE family transcriptional regulator [Actinomadura rubrisoli]
MTFGDKLHELMDERGISQRKLAKLVPCNDGYLSKVRRGLHVPSKKMAKRLDEILTAGGSLAALRTGRPKPQRSSQGRGAAAAGIVIPGINPDLWDIMERRALLQLAALGIGAGTLGSTGEPVRQLLALLLNSEPRGLDDWHLTLSDHLYATLTRPPAQARDGLMIDLLAIKHQLRRLKGWGYVLCLLGPFSLGSVRVMPGG